MINFSQTNAHTFQKQVIIDRKVFKMQRYSPCDLVLNLLNLFIFEILDEKSALTDHSKEMWVLILKGLKHLNSVLLSLFVVCGISSRHAVTTVGMETGVTFVPTCALLICRNYDSLQARQVYPAVLVSSSTSSRWR